MSTNNAVDVDLFSRLLSEKLSTKKTTFFLHLFLWLHNCYLLAIVIQSLLLFMCLLCHFRKYRLWGSFSIDDGESGWFFAFQLHIAHFFLYPSLFVYLFCINSIFSPLSLLHSQLIPRHEWFCLYLFCSVNPDLAPALCTIYCIISHRSWCC